MKSKTEEEKGLKKEGRGMTKQGQEEFRIHLILSFKLNYITQNFVQ